MWENVPSPDYECRREDDEHSKSKALIGLCGLQVSEELAVCPGRIIADCVEGIPARLFTSYHTIEKIH